MKVEDIPPEVTIEWLLEECKRRQWWFTYNWIKKRIAQLQKEKEDANV